MDWKQQLESYENKMDWKNAVEFMTMTLSEHQDDAEAWVRMLYLLHDLLLEHYPEKVGLDRNELEKLLLKYFSEASGRFTNDPEYLFFMGVRGHIAEYYFGKKDVSFAAAMSKKASEMEPDNRLYEWEKLRHIPGKENAMKARQIARDIIASDTPEKLWLETKGFPGNYILKVQLKGSAKLSDEWIEKHADKAQ